MSFKSYSLLALVIIISSSNIKTCNSIDEILRLIEDKKIFTITSLKSEIYGSDSLGFSEVFWFKNECLQGNKYLDNKVSNKLNYFYFDLTDYKNKFRNIQIAGVHNYGKIELLIASDITKKKYKQLMKYKSIDFDDLLLEYNQEFKTNYKSSDINAKYLESRTLGGACGAGGAPTDGFVFMMNMVRLKKKKEASDLLFSINSQDRLIGAFALEFLHRSGFKKSDREQEMIDQMKNTLSVADYCSGCTTQWSSISAVLSNDNNHNWYYQYKKIWKF